MQTVTPCSKSARRSYHKQPPCAIAVSPSSAPSNAFDSTLPVASGSAVGVPPAVPLVTLALAAHLAVPIPAPTPVPATTAAVLLGAPAATASIGVPLAAAAPADAAPPAPQSRSRMRQSHF